MAIKERNTSKEPLPTPSQIKSSPHSFSEEELKQLRELRTKLDQLTAKLGHLFINKIKLEEAEKQLTNQLSTLEKEETDLGKSLSKKYGNGSIDLDSGTFTPIK